MRTFSITLALLVTFVAVQMVSSDPEPQRPRFLDASPFTQPRRAAPPRGGPFPQPNFGRPPPARPQRPLLRGPPPNQSPDFTQESQPEEPDQVHSIGQLPLNPRPDFEEHEFREPEPQEFSGHEEELEGGFVPIVPERETEREDESEQRLEDQQPQAEERSSPGPFLDPTSAPEQRHSAEHQREEEEELKHSFEDVPQTREETSLLDESFYADPEQVFRGNQRLQEQETQEIEFLSAPPTTNIRKRNTARPNRPAHPNQLPVYHEFYNQNGELVEDGEEQEEEEEPDRLAILLLESKFSCVDKNNGYYADEDVSCEVFHYCQDRVKHSWLCPEGASFHQVHLICMPRSEDNICERSSNFHFVNEYLYKELDGPNKTYADRYYPEGFDNSRGISGGFNQQPLAVSGDGYQTVAQPDRFPVTQKTHRPATTTFQSQAPPTYQPSGGAQHSDQSFQPHGITDRVQQPDFQSVNHFSGVVGQHNNPSFQPPNNFGDAPFRSPQNFGDSQGQFAAFHSPEEVRVQRPHSRPQQQFRPGRRPGHFKRHSAQIG